MEELERITALEVKIENLENWQITQNGCLGRLESKVDGLYKQVTGLMGGMIVSLILLAINLALRN